MTFAHTSASYARGLSRAYHNSVSSSDGSDSMNIPVLIGMCNNKRIKCDTLCDWMAQGLLWLLCVAGGLVSSAPTAWRRACRRTWTPRASQGSASLCQPRTRVYSLAVPSKGTRQSRSQLASTQSVTAPSTHRDSGPTGRYGGLGPECLMTGFILASYRNLCSTSFLLTQCSHLFALCITVSGVKCISSHCYEFFLSCIFLHSCSLATGFSALLHLLTHFWPCCWTCCLNGVYLWLKCVTYIFTPQQEIQYYPMKALMVRNLNMYL